MGHERACGGGDLIGDRFKRGRGVVVEEDMDIEEPPGMPAVKREHSGLGGVVEKVYRKHARAVVEETATTSAAAVVEEREVAAAARELRTVMADTEQTNLTRTFGGSVPDWRSLVRAWFMPVLDFPLTNGDDLVSAIVFEQMPPRYCCAIISSFSRSPPIPTACEHFGSEMGHSSCPTSTGGSTDSRGSGPRKPSATRGP